ncbi:DUF6082 family protein [Nonomuraea sp. NPDC050022]|uniref:DUF6082 family protein n=1 Tax=unclassified Nonomuraea TaxID=2593643 RepID=UPI0033DBA190
MADLASPEQWELLSRVGQAYGPVATLVSAAGLVGVAMSVAAQARITRITAEQGLITRQFELSRLVAENPALIQTEGEIWRSHDDDFHYQSMLLLHHWLTHWRTMYALGLLTPAKVRLEASAIFRGQVGRDLWIRNREGYWTDANRRERQFLRLMDEELNKVEGTPARPTVTPRSLDERTRTRAIMITSAALVGFGILLGRGSTRPHSPWRR